MMQPHQRQWNGLTVDNGLRDEWLVGINALRHWSVYSTCEGHLESAGAGWSRYARIWLFLREEYYPSFAVVWHKSRERLRAMLSEHFTTPETHWNLFHEQMGRTEHIRNFTPPEDQYITVAIAAKTDEIFAQDPRPDGIGLYLDHAVMRVSGDMPVSTASWFDETVRSLEQYDSSLDQELHN